MSWPLSAVMEQHGSALMEAQPGARFEVSRPHGHDRLLAPPGWGVGAATFCLPGTPQTDAVARKHGRSPANQELTMARRCERRCGVSHTGKVSLLHQPRWLKMCAALRCN